MYRGVSMLQNGTCLNLKTAHENLHRNRAKNKVLNP